jgi:hypothetical protein
VLCFHSKQSAYMARKQTQSGGGSSTGGPVHSISSSNPLCVTFAANSWSVA